jgi:hypothetical protein
MLKLWQNPDFIIQDAAIADRGMVKEIFFSFYFLEHAGELHIFVLESEIWSNYKKRHRTWTKVRAVSGLTVRTRVTEI